MGEAVSLTCTHFLGCHGPLPQKDPGLLPSPHVEPGTVLQTSPLTHYCGPSGTACPHTGGFIAPGGGSAERNPHSLEKRAAWVKTDFPTELLQG